MHESEAPSRDDGVGSAEDVFRRATFNWALSTKRMVESSQALGNSTKVAWAALADIEYARDLLDNFYVPVAGKSPAAVDGQSPVTATEVRNSVSDLASRIVTTPCCDSVASKVQAHVNDIVGAPPIVCGPMPTVAESKPIVIKREPTPQSHRGVDLALPVWPKGGRMLWAGIDCTKCPSVAGKRCQKPDGTFMEKPHPSRDTQAKAMASVSETSGEKEDTAV